MNITHTHIFILICILQVLDVVTTLYCLRKGIGKEANPVMRKLMDAVGVKPALFGMKALVIGVTASSMTTTDTTSLWVLAAISAVVVINNALVIDRSRK
jgi:hypothetical protein